MRRVRLSPLDLLALGFFGIRTRRLRAALSALGIAIGVATMVVVTGVPASSRAGLLEQLDRLGTNLSQASAVPDQDPPVLLAPESVAMTERIAPVTAATAVANTHLGIQRNDRTDPASGTAVLAAHLDLLGVLGGHVGSGRFLDAANQRFPVVVLGAEAASRLGITEVAPGSSPQTVVDGRKFTVVGVLRPIPLAPEIDRAVLVGWDAARALLHFDGRPTVLYVRADDAAVEDVRAVLAATIHPQGPGLVRVSRPSDALAAKRATETTFSALFLGLAAVALLVGGIGVANTMVISVLERRREIGLRRSLGAHRGWIRAQFLAESVVLSLLGALTGAALGSAATVAYALRQGWPPVLSPQTPAGAVGVAVLVGIVAGGYPAIRAARLPPTEALAT
ncbi:ABC transporter permease [Actinoplanes friuliensis]|uniref:ABC transporter permease n=1 Tax=Actinoplanes friuliensis DSM 7358 TaxID=1246995 RepID=U5W3T8_9ACTN|nr:ABC transporter permease [Actinoplanes friuliensis]AGZ43799.1 ABC transporter permease [Actinoplanes friuliensis DSM 7358]